MFPHSLPPPCEGALPVKEFDVLLAAAQPRLKGYIASLLGAWADVDDLVQETNLVLLHKQEEFQAGSNFIAWAFRVAYFKASAWRRDRMREGRVMLDDSTFQMMAAHAETRFGELQPAVDVLADCLDELAPRERDLIIAKYVERCSLTEQAKQSGCSPNSLHKMISRIRLVLRHCIQRKLGRLTS